VNTARSCGKWKSKSNKLSSPKRKLDGGVKVAGNGKRFYATRLSLEPLPITITFGTSFRRGPLLKKHGPPLVVDWWVVQRGGPQSRCAREPAVLNPETVRSYIHLANGWRGFLTPGSLQ
jgi:hypothetical protein